MTRRPARRPTLRLPRLPGGRTALGVVLVAIVLLAGSAHLPLRHSGYVQDDHVAVENNPIVARGDVVEIFTTDYWAGASGADRSLYRPLTILSFALERRLSGGVASPGVSQGVNVLTHLLVTIALLALALRLGFGAFAAGAAALLFAVHPIHVEPIASIVGRAEMLVALFTFLALLAQSAAGPWPADRPGPSAPGSGARIAASWLAGLCLFLALTSKESAVAAPLLLVLLEALFRPAPEGRSARWWLDRLVALGPSVAAGFAYLCLRVVVLEGWFVPPVPHPLDNPIAFLTGTSRVATALSVAGRAVVLLLFPRFLSADYSGSVIPLEPSLLAPWPLLGLSFLLACALLVALPWLLGPKRRAAAHSQLAFAAAVFLLPYLVIGNLLVAVGTIFAERLLYLPSAGFCLLLALLLRKILHGFPRLGQNLAPESSLRRAGAVLVILLAAFTLLSWDRSHDWYDDETLFSATLLTRPRSPRANFIVAKARDEAGDVDAAIRGYERTLELWPTHGPAQFALGVIRARAGDMASAERLFRGVAGLPHRYGDPARAYLNLGLALQRQRRLSEAEAPLRKATLCRPSPPWSPRCDPTDPTVAKAWSALGNVRFESGAFAEAVDAYREAVARGWQAARPRLREALRRAGREG